MKIKSSAFENQGKIPKKHTGEAEDSIPPISIEGVPSQAKSLVIIVDDPDAPGGTFDHWIGWNIDPKTTKIDGSTKVPHQGTNGFGNEGYNGPMPPPGKPHRYYFKIFAIDTLLNLPDGTTKKNVEKAIEGHILDKAEIMGTYQR